MDLDRQQQSLVNKAQKEVEALEKKVTKLETDLEKKDEKVLPIYHSM